MQQLTIYTSKIEQEVDGVIDLLYKNGWKIIRHNLCEYPEQYFLTHCFLSDEPFGVHWLHSIPAFSTSRNLTGLEREVSIKESSAFWEGLWLSIPISQWLNPPINIYSASKKLTQLNTAKSLLINTPDWCISNSTEDIKKFWEKHDGMIVLKSLSCGYIAYGSKNIKFYTQPGTPRLLSKISTANLSPIIVQKRIIKRYEIRATVIDNKIYCTLLDYSKIPDIVDYRKINFIRHKQAFSPCPNDIINSIISPSLLICKALGLKYAGIDWVIDYSGSIYFIEINPLASFKWFEICGAGDITHAIAKSLIQTADEK